MTRKALSDAMKLTVLDTLFALHGEQELLQE